LPVGTGYRSILGHYTITGAVTTHEIYRQKRNSLIDAQIFYKFAQLGQAWCRNFLALGGKKEVRHVR
jgi:hypothetical protein